jgi:hypothetical protein
VPPFVVVECRVPWVYEHAIDGSGTGCDAASAKSRNTQVNGDI